MTVYFPVYYEKFSCIADKCQNSCCIGWEIGVDENTMKKYRSAEGELFDDIRRHINDKESIIRMCDDSRCPFLDCRGLCCIISSIGEENTPAICREHPRFYHQILDRVEGGIGASCEEACRIILSSDDFSNFVKIERVVEPSVSTDFDCLTYRNNIFALLSNSEISFSDKVKNILEEYNIPDIYESSFEDTFAELEYLNESSAQYFAVGERDFREESAKYLTRFLAYLIFRHASAAENYDDLRARIGFCLLLCAVFENALSRITPDLASAVEVVRIISEEIEYSEDNTDYLIMDMWADIM